MALKPFMSMPGPARKRSAPPRWRRWFLLLVGLALLALAPVLAYSQGLDSVVVVWTAPGDDGRTGTATAYDLRWSLSPITAANFASATPLPGVPAPAASGTRQRVTARDLTRGTTYYFAIRTVDDAGNWSGLSNVARWDWNLDTSPPAAPQGVTAQLQSAAVRVAWTANTEPDLGGYTVYRSTSAAGPFEALNGSLLTSAEYLDTNLPANAKAVWYQVSASDASGNESAHSASVSVSLTAPSTAQTTSAVTVEDGYPNPSHASAPVNIPIMNPNGEASDGTIDILDAGGRLVRRIPVRVTPGLQEAQWDGKNDAGREVAPGAYRAVLNVSGNRSSIRLLRVP